MTVATVPTGTAIQSGPTVTLSSHFRQEPEPESLT